MTRPHPIIPQTPQQAHERDQLSHHRQQPPASATVIAEQDDLQLVNTGHGLALRRHGQHFPVTPSELQWLAAQTLKSSPESQA